MNTEWCLAELNRFVDLWTEYDSLTRRSYGASGQFPSQDELDAADRKIMEQFPVVVQILKAIQGKVPSNLLYHRAGDGFLEDRGSRDAAMFAIGRLRRQQEISENLAPPSPALSADELHPWVWEPARSLWETRHFREAVQAASTGVNAHLQELVGRRDIFDSDLINQSFSDRDPEPKKARLRWPGDPTDAEYRAMQAGLRAFGQGAFMTIRNRVTHDLDELTEHEALERLAALSLLCRWIGMCNLEVSEQP